MKTATSHLLAAFTRFGRKPSTGAPRRAASPHGMEPLEARIAPATFTNSTGITIPDSGASNPFPSSITVTGLADVVTDVNVTLNGISHTFPSDLDVLLVGPEGQKFILVSDAGGGTDLVNRTITFDDQSANVFATTGGWTTSNSKPVNYRAGDTFPTPAPGGPYLNPGLSTTPGFTAASINAAFAGTNPNGVWSLYILDDAAVDVGTVSGGWTLELNGTVVVVPETTAAVDITPARKSSDIFMLLRRNERAQLGSRPRPVPEIC